MVMLVLGRIVGFGWVSEVEEGKEEGAYKVWLC